MNKNLTRDRCQITELESVRLKKVSFCVDVEVSVPPPIPRDDDYNNLRFITGEQAETERVASIENKQSGANTSECEEKHVPGHASGNQTKESGITANENMDSSNVPKIIQYTEGEVKAEQSGNGIAESKGGDNAAVITGNKPPQKRENAGPRPRRRPTTDVARIYKRCCQLREATVLSIIAEQLAVSAGKTSLDSLDLSNHTLHLSDALVLSDFLALAPVTKLDLENCGLTDESLRVILSGLLAVKKPVSKIKSSQKRTKDPVQITEPIRDGTTATSEGRPRGMVEWLSLRNNPRLGRDGWRYISLFLHMSRSLKALDVSMIQLPRMPLANGLRSRQIPDSTAIFCKALSERLAGAGLQELAMNRCGINTEQLRCIVEAVRNGGTKRLDLEGNNVTDDGLIYLAQWIKEGSCEGISLSSNDLQVRAMFR